MYLKENHINGVMVSVLASSGVDRGFEQLANQSLTHPMSEREVFLAILQENRVPMIF